MTACHNLKRSERLSNENIELREVAKDSATGAALHSIDGVIGRFADCDIEGGMLISGVMTSKTR